MELLRDFLRERQLSQAAMARTLDYPPELISLVLAGKRAPSDRLKLRFLQAYGSEAYDQVFNSAAQREAVA